MDKKTYDNFKGPDFNSNKWKFLEYPMPDGEPWVCREPQSRITVADGVLSVDIDRFELENPVQPIDNCKFVLLSTESFRVPSQGKLVVSAKMTGSGKGTAPYDWKDGFASLVVTDRSTGWVFDVVAIAEAIGAIHERLPISPEVQWFTNVVEAPLIDLGAAPEKVYQCEITLDAAAHTATWVVDGHEIYRAKGIEIPPSVNVGMGIFTLRPVVDGESRSVRGQGFGASWSNIKVTVI